jgi:hypothetical protein
MPSVESQAQGNNLKERAPKLGFKSWIDDMEGRGPWMRKMSG